MDTMTNTNLSADEMILANGAAEARETERLKDTADRYAEEIEELKALYNKNSALVEELRSLNMESAKGIQDIVDDAVTRLRDAGASIQNIDFAEPQDKILESVQQAQNKIADLLQQSDDFSHKENVRVYRNIQAATDQLLQKQTTQLTEALEPLKMPVKPKATGIQICTLLLVIAGVVLEILNILGVFSGITL